MVYTDLYGAGAFSCCMGISSISAQGGEGVPTTEAAAEAETLLPSVQSAIWKLEQRIANTTGSSRKSSQRGKRRIRCKQSSSHVCRSSRNGVESTRKFHPSHAASFKDYSSQRGAISTLAGLTEAPREAK